MRTALLFATLVAVSACDSGTPDTPLPVEPGTPVLPGASATGQLYPVLQNGRPALIDSTGRVVVALDRYNATDDAGGGYVPARYWDGRQNVWDVFDAAGAVAFSVAADNAEAPRGGLARIRIDGRYGFVDTAGRFVVNPYLNDARDVREGVARVKTTGSRWGLMNTSGRLVVEPTFTELSDVSDGLAKFKDDNTFGFIDVTGTRVIAAVYAEARSFHDGLAAVREGDRWVYVDRTNARAMGGRTFISAGDLGSGLAPVRTEDLWEYVDRTGARVLGPQFAEARRFVGGRAAVKVGGLWTFIDPAGTLLGAPRWDEVSDFEGALARVVLGGKTGYVDRSGGTVYLPRD